MTSPAGDLQPLVAVRRGASYALKSDPLRGKVTWTFQRR